MTLPPLIRGMDGMYDNRSWVLTPCENETQTGIRACGDAKRGKIPDMNAFLRDAQKDPNFMGIQKWYGGNGIETDM